MALKITKSNEPITVNSVCVMVYGQPGVGKTSLAFTAESPLLLDFDRGSYRSGFRKDTVQIESWRDVAEISPSDLQGYQTVVVDTVGRLLDLLAVHIIQDNPKMKGYGGALSLQGYGALKSAYAGWLKSLLALGKDVVLIAHDKEEKNGEDLIVRPDIQGGSYGEVFKRADGVAYLHKVGRETILDFNPTDRWVGKNAGDFAPLSVPNFATRPGWLGEVLKDLKDALNSLSAEQVAAMQLVADWRAKMDEITDADGINASIADAAELDEPVLSQVRALIKSRAEALQLVYEGKRGAGKYVSKAAA